MLTEYRTAACEHRAETVIKKSRFIGQIYPCGSMEQAGEIMARVRREFWDARHSCSAVITGAGREYMRSSDDGEPQGTAGIPILEAMKGSGLTNVMCVVTRYFGGVLLGAGGLVRAYSGTAAQVLAQAEKVIYAPRRIYACEFSFKQWNRAQALLSAAGFFIGDISYAGTVTASVAAKPETEDELIALVAAVTAGGASPVFMGEEYAKIPL